MTAYKIQHIKGTIWCQEDSNIHHRYLLELRENWSPFFWAVCCSFTPRPTQPGQSEVRVEAVDAAVEHLNVLLHQGGGQHQQWGPEVALHHELARHAPARRHRELLSEEFDRVTGVSQRRHGEDAREVGNWPRILRRSNWPWAQPPFSDMNIILYQLYHFWR